MKRKTIYKLPKDKKIRRVLQKRAEKYSKPFEEEKSKNLVSFVGFTIGNEKYGILENEVEFVFPIREFTPLPGLPPYFLGIVSYQGKVVPLLDMAVPFQISREVQPEEGFALLLRKDDLELALFADKLEGIKEIHKDQLSGTLSFAKENRHKFLKAITEEPRGFFDIQKVVNLSEWKIK
ncbi:MAG: chemotaxis protein CheW [Planctomycetota bacterium]|nr:MAG: chemotaxis protein CheW [Planctomycetota bacterium]